MLNGKLLAAGGDDGIVRVWNAITGDEKKILKGYKARTNIPEPLFVRFLPNGTLLTVGAAEKDDGSLKVWDAETGTCSRAFANPNMHVWWTDVTADGKTAIVGGRPNKQSFMIVPISD